MPITYSVDKSQDVIHEIWQGNISAIDLKKYWITYLGDPDVIKCMRTLVDLRKATIEFNGPELEQLINTIVIPVIGQKNGRQHFSSKNRLNLE